MQKTKETEQKRGVKEVKKYEVYYSSKTQNVFFLLYLSFCPLLDGVLQRKYIL